MINAPSSRLNELGAAAAEVMGDASLGPKVVDVMQASIGGEYIFHGTKNEDFAERIEVEGVMPKTPEGGRNGAKCSFWTAGEKLFFSQASTLETFDTTFFHYGHLKARSPNQTVMAVIVASLDRLRTSGVIVPSQDFDSGYFSIDKHVPTEAIDVVKATRERDETLTPRENVQAIERDLLRAMWSYFQQKQS